MRGLLYLAGLVGCYSANAQPGAPCSPAAPFCPDGQSCAPFAGGYACLAGATPLGDAAIDTLAVMIDAPPPPIDARPDAAIDAPPPHWALVQVAADATGMATMTASGSGHTIIVAIETDTTGAVTAVGDDVSNTYVAIAGSRSTSSAEGAGVEIWYASNATAGATVVKAVAPTVYATVVWEVAGLQSTGTVDAVAKLDDQPTTTTPMGAPITTTRDGDFVVSAAMVGNTIQSIHAGNAFTNDKTTQGDAWAHLTSNAAPAGTYQAEWDQPNTAVYCTSSAAFLVGP